MSQKDLQMESSDTLRSGNSSLTSEYFRRLGRNELLSMLRGVVLILMLYLPTQHAKAEDEYFDGGWIAYGEEFAASRVRAESEDGLIYYEIPTRFRFRAQAGDEIVISQTQWYGNSELVYLAILDSGSNELWSQRSEGDSIGSFCCIERDGTYIFEYFAFFGGSRLTLTRGPINRQADQTCALSPALQVGGRGLNISDTDNRMRTGPSSSLPIVGVIAGGEVVDVLEGPILADGYYWWRVHSSGIAGWAAESGDCEYWLAPTDLESGDVCALSPQLRVGGRAQNINGTSNRMRNGPALSEPQVSKIQSTEVVDVLAGPVWADGYYWWQVRKDDYVIGWTAESGNCEYWMAPTDGRAAGGVSDCSPPTRLEGAQWAVNISGDKLPFYAFADGYNHTGEIDPLDMEYLAEPGEVLQAGLASLCLDGSFWFLTGSCSETPTGISKCGQGFMREGKGDEYFVAPVEPRSGENCALIPGLQVGGRGQVSPGPPNNMRSGPSLSDARIGRIPSGEVVDVLAGPVFADGYNWWRVRHGDLIGWTVESGDCEYWIVPVGGRVTGGSIASSGSGGALQGGGHLGYGDRGAGYLDNNNFFDDYKFDARVGDRVTISMDRTGGDLDPALRLYSSAGQELAFDDDGGGGTNALVSDFQIPADGEYTIHALRLREGQAGQYDLRLMLSDPAPSSVEQADSADYGYTVTGWLDDGNFFDDYKFNARAGEYFTILMDATTGDVDPAIRLYNSAGRELAYDNDGGSGINARLSNFRMPADGEYTIHTLRLREDQEGGYELRLTRATPKDKLGYGDKVSSWLENDTVVHEYRFEARAGDRVTIEIWGHSGQEFFIPGLRLFNNEGVELTDDYSVLQMFHAHVPQFRIPADGDYTIQAFQNHEFGTGAYDLQLRGYVQPAGSGEIRISGDCTLTDAITAANKDRAVAGCPAGNGRDTIVLSGDITLESELPAITSYVAVEGGGNAISGDNRFRIFFVSESGELIVRNVILKHGYMSLDPEFFDDSCPKRSHHLGSSGGAICNHGSLSVSDSAFSDNAAKSGGAISNWGALHITGSEFSGNSAIYSGGAIESAWDFSLSDSAFSDNAAKSGGAIETWGALHVTRSDFSGNSATLSGGAIYSNFGDLDVTLSQFNGNSAGKSAGAIYMHKANAQVNGSTFSFNSPDDCVGLECVSVPGGGRTLATAAQDESRAAQESSAGGPISVGGACTLADAITAANEDRAVGGCQAGVDGDTILLTGDIVLGASLPEITADIFIDGSGFTISGDSQYRIFVVGGGAHVVIDRLTLANGSGDWDGGALLVHGDSELTVTNSIFSNNSTVHAGGAILVRDSEAIIFSSSFNNNSAEWGGAIHVWDSGTLTANNVTFDGNITDSRGSAVDIRSQSASLTDVRFRENRGGSHLVTAPAPGSVTINCFYDDGGNSPNSLDPDVDVTNDDCVGAAPDTGSTITAAAAESDTETTTPEDTEAVDAEAEQEVAPDGDQLSISIGESYRGSLLAGEEYHEFQFPVATLVGKTISIQVIARDGDLVPGVALWLDGEIARDDNGDGDALAQLKDVDVDWGRYVISVWSVRGRGSYELLVVEGELPASEPGPIKLSDACNLEDAITAANVDAPVGGCPAGSGADTVVLSGDITVAAGERRVRSAMTIIGNGHTINGGGTRIFVVAEDGDLSLQDVVLVDARATADNAPCIPGEDWTRPLGGAVCNLGRLSVSGSTFARNTADDTAANVGSGGAIYNFGTLEVTDSMFQESEATIGGAIGNEATMTVSGSNFHNNSSRLSGGALGNFGDGNARLSANSQFSDNVAQTQGGAIANSGALVIDNNQFHGNEGLGGGAVYNFSDADLTVERSTFAANSGIGLGGGAILNVHNAYGSVSNSEFSGNNPDDCLGVDCGNTIQLSGVDYTLIRDAAATNNQRIIESGAFQRAYQLHIQNPGRLKDDPLKVCFPTYFGEPMGIWMLLDETRNPPELRTLFAWREAASTCVAVDRLGTIVKLRASEAAAQIFTSTNNWRQTRDAIFEGTNQLALMAFRYMVERAAAWITSHATHVADNVYARYGDDIIVSIKKRLPQGVFKQAAQTGGASSVDDIVLSGSEYSVVSYQTEGVIVGAGVGARDPAEIIIVEWSDGLSDVTLHFSTDGFANAYGAPLISDIHGATELILGENALRFATDTTGKFVNYVASYFNAAFIERLMESVLAELTVDVSVETRDRLREYFSGLSRSAEGADGEPGFVDGAAFDLGRDYLEYEGLDFDGIGGFAGQQISDTVGADEDGWVERVSGFTVDVGVGVATGTLEKHRGAGGYGELVRGSFFALEAASDIAVNAWMNEPLHNCQITTTKPTLARVTPKGFVRSVVPADATLPVVGRTADDFKIYFYSREQDVTAWIPVGVVRTTGDCGTGGNMFQRAADWITVVATQDCSRADIETCG